MVLYRLDQQLGGYLRGQFLDCLGMGVLVALVLVFWVSSMLCSLAPLLELPMLSPIIGPIAGAIPGMLVLLLDPNPPNPWWSIPILFILIKAFDDVVLYPQTVGKKPSLASTHCDFRYPSR